ncbi:hypothetical protein BU24DRAFT_437940 [Aaosphaeria arxii CBS 175.79]|uniref:D-isomer specific 2-hydroxyacid dehydrogenase NAD-binding domain-containing protein n=1 Tax=Aaosphaeria arxii CBS 175.79 TaxID=1450172 RepID=A0A6A5X674_9PLEO|nr:uncharacterized protein BU24DRAFT_437940 [Aaosphaeria arxii CBS 175.79]KAF2008400.1 hypothetical protein BU24DRAFT_437940 [Aaosphaeria arxii CBS 175.79]
MAPARIEIDSAAASPPATIEKPTVYLLDTFHPEAVEHAQNLFNAIIPSDPKHAQWRENAEYLLIRGSYLTAKDVASCPNLKAIGKQGVGIDKIDEAACKERGIKIFNTPGVNAQAVAETVLTLTMSVAREVSRITTSQSHGKAVPKETCSGLIISNKTIGIVGMGNIGHRVAKIFQRGLRCNVVAYDPFLPKDAWSDIEHTRAEKLESLLENSDIVTLHIPLLPQTRNLIGYEQFSTMKRNAIIINTARGGIVNEADLERALKDKLIWGAGLDCHEQEPPTKEKYGALWETGRVMETAKAAVDRLWDYVKVTRQL